MPRRLSHLPGTLTGAPFRFDDAVAAGVSRRLLRSEQVLHPHRGVYDSDVDHLDVVSRAQRLLAVLGGDHWVSHLTAARVLGAPMPTRYLEDEPLHVTALGGADRVPRPGVRGWKTEADVPRTIHAGVPVVAPADMWCQLAVPGATGSDARTGRRWCLSEEWLVAVGDYLVTGPGRGRHRTPWCSIADLHAAVRRRRGKRGVKALVAALPRIRQGAHSPEETFLRLALVDHGLPEPVVQIPVMTPLGMRHADLGYRKPGSDRLVLIEFQGDHHRTDRAQWLADLTRVQVFSDAGHRPFLVGAEDVHKTPAALAARIRRALLLL